MANILVSAAAFVAWLAAGCDSKLWGYIMGAWGQAPKDLSTWYFTGQYDGADQTAALRWLKICLRVFDCNGLFEAFYHDQTGININARARNNYTQWCGTRGTGKIPAAHRAPGAAVFMLSNGVAVHVGFLERPVSASNPSGDWYVIEARGVRYGVVRTRLNARSWNAWGLMTQYVDYAGAGTASATPTLRRGDAGDAVKQAQDRLIAHGYKLPLYGADSDFGAETEAAVLAFQTTKGLEADGVVGAKTWAALLAEPAPAAKVYRVVVTGRGGAPLTQAQAMALQDEYQAAGYTAEIVEV